MKTKDEVYTSDCTKKNYHTLFEQANDAIMVTDFTGNFKDVNSGLCTLFGFTKEELLRTNVKTLLDQEHLQKQPIRFDLLAMGQNILSERKMVHKNGDLVYVEVNAKKIDDEHILAIARNITERKKVESILQKSEANLHTIFDNTDTIYILINTDLSIISYNQRAHDFAEKELGHSIEISEFFLDYFPEEKKPVLKAYMNAVLAGQSIHYEVSYPQENGSSNWYNVRMFPISKDNQPIYGLMMAVSDITEKKILEQKLLEQKIQEQKKITRAVVNAQEKERAGIGRELHDNVNQLLAASSLYLTHSLKRPELDRKSIEKSSEYINTAMEELRKLSHALVGPSEDKAIGLIDSLEELINNISAVKDIKIIFTHTKYGQGKSEVGLKLIIYRIIQEQLSNILKHAGASEINIELRREEKDLIVIINDNGKGFDLSAKRKGIGLKNIYNRAQIYNGLVNIESSPGNGCQMKIVFKGKH